MHNLSIALFSIVFLLSGGNYVKAEPTTIAALGDSLVHGYGIDPADGFVAQLQQWLDDHGADVTLINAGVSGDTTAGGLARIDWTLSPDVNALIVSLGGNDALRGIDPAAARENLDAILAVAVSRELPILIVGIQAPGNFGEAYKLEFEATYADLAEKYGVLLYPNFLQALMVLPDRAATLENLFQADGIHPNAKGVALIVEDIGPSVAELVKQVGAAN